MIDDKIIAELKTAHGKIGVVTAATGGELVFRKPRRAEYDRWFDKREESPTSAARELAQACLVHPDRDGMIALLDEQPALLMCGNGIIDTLTDLAGVSTATTAQKKIL